MATTSRYDLRSNKRENAEHATHDTDERRMNKRFSNSTDGEFNGFNNSNDGLDDASVYEDSFAEQEALRENLREMGDNAGNIVNGNGRAQNGGNDDGDQRGLQEELNGEGNAGQDGGNGGGNGGANGIAGAANQGNPIVFGEPPQPADVFTMLLEQNRRRDEMMERMMVQLAQFNMNRPPSEATSAIPTYHIMPDLSKDIQTFDGEKGNLVAKEWLRGIESRKTLHNWPESFTLETARSHLRRGARHWLRRRDLPTWAAFKTAFTKTFIGSDSLTDRWQRMTSRIQQKGESLTAYFHEKMRMCEEVNLPFKESREQVLIGLWSRDLRTQTSPKEHKDEDAFLHDLIEQQRMIELSYERRSSKIATDKSKTATDNKPHDSSDGFKAQHESHKPGATSFAKRAPSRNEQGQPKCYNCNVYGHISRECPEKVNVSSGSKPNNDERKHTPKQPSTGEVRRVDGVTQNAAQKYYKEVNINGYICKAFIDAGSSECTLKASTALMQGFHITRQLMSLKSFGPSGFTVTSSGFVESKITVDGVNASRVKVRVVPDDCQPVDVLIGRTFTELPHVSYYKDGNKLVFKTRDEPDEVDEDDGTQGQPEITQEVELPAASMNFVAVDDGATEHLLPILNLGDDPTKLMKGECLLRNCELTQAPLISPTRSVITEDDIHEINNQPKEAITELLNILNKHRDAIATSEAEFGCTDLLEMDIKELPGSHPVMKRPYPASDDERERIRKIVQEWKDRGIVTETESPYASPVLLVKKKSNKDRLVIDFRAVNKQTERIHFPIPSMDEYMTQIGDADCFAVLDLAHGYLQVPLKKEARSKTAFITPDETGECTRVMPGLVNTSFYFSMVMQRVLMPLRHLKVVWFMDDIFLCGKGWRELLDKLKVVLEALQAAGLTIKLSKCKFLMERVSFLGFEISAKGVEPGLGKVEAIRQFPTPTNAHRLRRFMGMISFFRRFIVGCAKRARPLSDLLKANAEYKWSEEAQASFDDLKAALTAKPMLMLYDRKRETELHTDASATGLAAMLFQKGDDSKFHLIYAISRSTSDAEANYHSSKLEMLAIVWAVNRLRNFLINIHFTIITDCQALMHIHVGSTKNPQMIRWQNQLSEYDYEIRHRPGEKMQHVDALSRAPLQTTEEEDGDEMWIFSISRNEEEVLLYQYYDESIQRKIKILKKEEADRTSSETSEIEGFVLDEGLLYKREGNDLKFVIGKAMRKGLVIRYHDLHGHFGLDRTLRNLKEFYFFPNIKSYVRQHIRACLHCITTKTITGRQPGELHPIAPGHRPFAVTHIDHIGPFVTSAKKNQYILVIVDNLTKFVCLEPCRNTKAADVVKRMEDFVHRFGAPERLISDRGTCFTSTLFEEFCKRHGIRHTLNSPRHAQANGQVERVNRTLVPVIQANLEEGKFGRDWDRNIKDVALALNTSFNRSTTKTPFELLYGYKHRCNDGITRLLTIEEERKRYQRPEQLQQEAREKILKEQELYKARYDQHRYRNVFYNIGDIVYLRTVPTATGESTKLQLKWRGPLVVYKLLPSDTYGVTDLQMDACGRRYASTAHVS